MGKHYDINLKNKVVNDYFSNEGGVIYLGKKYNISSNTIQHWINKQKIQGNQINDIDNLRGRPKEENIDYKERYEILKKFQEFIKAQREKK